MEDVVAEDQGDRVLADELAADDERLGQPVGHGLLGVGELDPPLRAVAEQLAEPREVGRGRDDQDLADARQHQDAERVVDHRLVVDRQELLADHPGQRVEPGPRAAGQDDPLRRGRRAAGFMSGPPARAVPGGSRRTGRPAPVLVLEVPGDGPPQAGLERLGAAASPARGSILPASMA